MISVCHEAPFVTEMTTNNFSVVKRVLCYLYVSCSINNTPVTNFITLISELSVQRILDAKNYSGELIDWPIISGKITHGLLKVLKLAAHLVNIMTNSVNIR